MKQEITYEDYSKVEIKIGTVLRVAETPDGLNIVQSVLDISATELCYCNDNSDELVDINS